MPIKIIGDIAVDISGNEFLEPYLLRELLTDDDCDTPPRAGVRITTDDTEGDFDADFDRYCQERSLAVAVIRCPYIVGTGMNGLMCRIAAGIYKGSYVQIKGNVARISVVHAVDVARAAKMAAGIQGTFTLTDGTDPTISQVAEALSYRLGDKRLITIKPRWAKLWYGSSYFDILTTDHRAQDTFCLLFPDFKPVTVIDYLHTHVYDQQSL